MQKTTALLVLISVLFPIDLWAAHPKRYFVLPNDTLSSILLHFRLKPLYGPQGSLEQSLALNPELKNRRGNLIRPGQEIFLPLEENEQLVSDQPSPRSSASTDTDVPVTLVSEPETDETLASLSFALGTGFISLRTQDSSGIDGTTDTNAYYFTKIFFRQFWTNIGLTTEFQAGFHHIELAPPHIETHSKDSFNTLSFGALAEKDVNIASISLGVYYGPSIYIAGRSGTIVQTNVAQLGELQLGLRKNILSYKKLSADLKAGGLLVIPQQRSDIEFKSGWGYQAGFETAYRMQNWALNADLLYKKKLIQTNLGTSDPTDLTLSLGMSYEFH